MGSTFTTNKHLEKPANNDDINVWDVPVNGNSNVLDSALGGVTSINVTAVVGPTITLSNSTASPPSYICPIFVLAGTLGANLNYQFPSGVGGQFSVYNNTTGPFSLTFSSAGGGTSIVIPQGSRVLLEVDGTNVTAALNEVPTIGIGMTPINIFDIAQTQNGASIAAIRNTSAGAGASSCWAASNGTHGLLARMYGTGYTTSGENRQDGALLFTDGTGGMAYSIPSDAFRWYVGGFNYLTLSQTNLTALVDVNAAHLLVNGAGGGTVTLTGFGNTNVISTRDYITNDGSGITMQCVSGGVVLSNGATSWVAASARAYKRDISPIPDGAVGRIRKLPKIFYRYNEDSDDTPLRVGTLYEDAAEVMPYITAYRPASERKDEKTGAVETIKEHKGVSLELCVPDLLKAVDELSDELAAIRAEMAELRASIS